MRRRFGRALVAALFGLALAGCKEAAAPDMTMPPPAVTVSHPLEREVTAFNDFTGRTAAVDMVQIRARVWGHLEKINFQEGAEVKKGDVLFIIDQRPYKATLARADADVGQSEARLQRLQGDHARAATLVQTRAISREEFDKIGGDLAEASSAVRSAIAGREVAKLNLEFTEVRAPISGRIGRAMVTAGNMVSSGESGGTMLTTIVSIDPMYAYFDVDDVTYLEIGRLMRRAKADEGEKPAVLLSLANEKDFPHRGWIDFVDNQVDPGTGTMRMRGVFPNADGPLTPGMFARIRVPLGSSRKAILVTDRAVDTDQGQKVLYAVNSDNVIERRTVRLGRLFDGLREVESGIRPGDRVVVDGLQRVRPGLPVQPHLIDMPGGPSNAVAAR